jgi:class 3 adenylate cyclase
VLNNASQEGNYTHEQYILENKSKSVLCAPLISRGKLVSIIYLENSLTTGAFTKDRLKVLELLTSQAAISIENAFHYENLELKVKERTHELIEEQKKVNLANKEIIKEKEKSDSLLRNILPEETAMELKLTGKAVPKQYKLATVMFTDFVGFTIISQRWSPLEIQMELNYIFGNFDDIITTHKLEKIKTIGDSYMCAGGLPTANTTNPVDTVLAALEIQKFMQEYKNLRQQEGKEYFECRLGINTGSLIAGIVGKSKYAYDIWGSTVNTASKMENTGEVGQVNISESTYHYIKEYFICSNQRTVEAKNQGIIKAYFVERLHPEFSADSLGLLPNVKLNLKR